MQPVQGKRTRPVAGVLIRRLGAGHLSNRVSHGILSLSTPAAYSEFVPSRTIPCYRNVPRPIIMIRMRSGDPRRPQSASRGHRFQQHERLLLRREFDRVFESGCRAADGLLTVFVAANGRTYSRFGISVGRQVGGAVERNRAKRRIREAFRTQKHDLPGGLDIVCLARPAAALRDSDVSASLKRLIVRAVSKRKRSP